MTVQEWIDKLLSLPAEYADYELLGWTDINNELSIEPLSEVEADEEFKAVIIS